MDSVGEITIAAGPWPRSDGWTRGLPKWTAGIKGFDRLGGVPFQRFSIALLAHGHARLGHHSEAFAMLDQALKHVERSGEFDGQAEMLRLKGEILLMGRRAAAPEAERCFRAALDVARAQEAKWWELRATVSLARLIANMDAGRSAHDTRRDLPLVQRGLRYRRPE